MLRPVTVAANLRVGFDALRIHPLRTLLSVLGITIGCAALIATLAVSDGLMGFARDTIRRETSVQVVTVSPRHAVFRDGEWVPVHDVPVFTQADARSLRDHVGIAEGVAMAISGRVVARRGAVRHRAQIALGTASLPDFGGVDVGAGRFFTEAEEAHRAPVVVVNHALARELAPGTDPFTLVGREIHVHDRRQRVVGVLAPGPFEDREDPSFTVLAPLGSARGLLDLPPGERPTPAIQLLAPSVESVEELRDAVEDWLARRDPRWRERVSVDVRLEELSQVEQAFTLLKLFVGALVGISLLVGGIGIMNVLLASVAERTREIGIRKSVGARSADIRLQFLTEAVAIALVGAAAGLVGGFLIALAVTLVFRQVAGVAMMPVLSPLSVVFATAASSLVGLVFGTYPARRAAGLPPVVAIAQE